MKERNRFFALLLAVMMVVTYMPSMAFAAAGDESEATVATDSVMLSYESANPLTIVVNGDGSIKKETIVDPGTGEEEVVEYFHYNWTLIKKGDKLIFHGDEYTASYNSDYEDWLFINSKEEIIRGEDLSYYDNQSYDNQWSIDNPGKIIIEYKGESCEVPVTIVENPIHSISFQSVEPITLKENEGGFMYEGEEWNAETQQYEYYTYYKYFTSKLANKEGNKIIINGDEVYTYSNPEGNVYRFYNSDGVALEKNYLKITDDQSYDNQWSADNPGMITVSYMGVGCEVPVTIIGHKVTGISFTPVNEYINLIEGIDGREYNGSFRYSTNFENGDKLTLHFSDGDDATYKYLSYYGVFENIDDSDDWIYRVTEEGMDGFRLYTDQSEQWMLTEGDNYYEMLITYQENNQEYTTLAKKIRILPNPVESIAFSRNGKNSIELIDGKDNYSDEAEEEEEGDYRRFRLRFKLGDHITVTMTDGSTAVYEYTRIEFGEDSKDRFVNIKDDTDILDNRRPDIYAVTDQSSSNPWVAGGSYKAAVEYFGRTVDVDVNILPNPVTNIEFETAGNTGELLEYVDGEWHTNEETGEKYFWYYFPGFSIGDTLTITKNGENVKYEFREGVQAGDDYDRAFVNFADDSDVIPENDVRVSGSNQRYSSLWEKGGDGYFFKFRYSGVEFEIPVTIVDGDLHECVGKDPVRENEVAATCMAEGSYDEVVYCTRCGKELSRVKKSVAKTAHTEEVIPAIPATCTTAGSTEGKKCAVCGTVTVAPQEVPALGHDYQEVEGSAKAATTTEAGKEADQKCSRCGAVITGAVIPKIEPSEEEKVLAKALEEADKQTNDASGKADAASSSTDDEVVTAAEDSAVKAAELAAKAEAAAEQAFDKAEAAYNETKKSGDEVQIETAKNNLDVATNNLATAKVIKAAASSAAAKAKQAAARIAAAKAEAASEAAKAATDSAAAEELRKEAETQAAIAAEKAASAETASAEASKAAADLGELADKIADPAVKEAVKKEQAAAEKSAEAASESAKAAETSTEEAKASEAAAEEAVSEKTRQGVYDSKIPKMTIKSKTSKKTSITIKWKWTSSGKKKLKKSKATKYEIWVCPNKKFAKEDTVVKTCSKSKSSYTVKSLKKNKKYYFKVRAIKYVNGVKHVGKWSSLKYIKTKKK